MLIALTTNDADSIEDQTIEKMVALLKKQYPDERSVHVDELFKTKKTLTELNGEFPTRLTFAGHSDWDKNYNGYSPKEFAEEIKAWLRSMAKKHPEFAKNLTHIDLIGCEIGLTVGENTFASEFARMLSELQLEGFNDIQVHAFTNLSFDNPHQYSALRVYVYDSSFNVFAFANEEIAENYQVELNKIQEEKIQKYTVLDNQYETLIERKNKMQTEYEQIIQQTDLAQDKIRLLKVKAEDIKIKKQQFLKQKQQLSTSLTTEVNKLNQRKEQMKNEFKHNQNDIEKITQAVQNLNSLECKLSEQIFAVFTNSSSYVISPSEEKAIKKNQETKRELQKKRHAMEEKLNLANDKQALLFKEKEVVLAEQNLLNQKKSQLEVVNMELHNVFDEMNKLDTVYQDILSTQHVLAKKKIMLEEKVLKLNEELAANEESMRDIENVGSYFSEAERIASEKYNGVILSTGNHDTRQFLDSHPECNFTQQSKLKHQGKHFFTQAACRLFTNKPTIPALTTANQRVVENRIGLAN